LLMTMKITPLMVGNQFVRNLREQQPPFAVGYLQITQMLILSFAA
jgi:hypothetical protein